MFWQFNIVNQFWERIEQCDKSNYMINIDRQRAIFGISNNSAAIFPVNYVLLITRHYIYRCKIISTGLNLSSWENCVKQFLEIEKTNCN